MSKGKWNWKTRLKHINEVCYMMANLDDMPTWETLTIEEAAVIVKDVVSTHDNENGDWDNPQERADYYKAVKWLEEYGGKPTEKTKKEVLPRTVSLKNYHVAYRHVDGNIQQGFYPARNAQEAVNTVRNFAGNVEILTVAKVVGGWK